MTLLTAVQVADYWLGAGGPKSRAVEFVAIAMGESGLDTRAVSSAGALGVWQIMPFNAPAYGYVPNDLFNPAVNARITVAMSGGGVNCAAWDSAYLDIERSGRYSFLPWPEMGSADYDNLSAAAAELEGHGLAAAAGMAEPAVATTLASAIARMQQIGDKSVPAVTAAVAAGTRAAHAAYRIGWRP